MHSKGRHLSYNFLSSVCRISQALATASDYYVCDTKDDHLSFLSRSCPLFHCYCKLLLKQLEALSHSCWLNRYRNQPEGAPSFSKTNPKVKTRKKTLFKPCPFMLSPEQHFWNKNSGCYTFFVPPLKLDSRFLGFACTGMYNDNRLPSASVSNQCLWLLLCLITRSTWF